MRTCYICPAYATGCVTGSLPKCILDVPEEHPETLTHEGCTLDKKTVNKMLKDKQKKEVSTNGTIQH